MVRTFRIHGLTLALVFTAALSDAGEALTLDRARALAFERSPALAAKAHAVESSRGALDQAGVLPNPRLEATLEDFGGSGSFAGARRAESTLRVAEVIELGGKRSARVDAARRGTDLAELELVAERAELAAEVAERFGHVLGDQAELDLRREATATLERSGATVERQVGAGRLSEIEASKARVFVARSRIEEEHAEHELRSARRRLAALWDDADPSFERAEGGLFERPSLPDFNALAVRLASAPPLRRADAEIAARAARVELARTRATPDLDLAIGPRHYHSDDEVALVLGLSLPISFFDRNRGGIAEALGERRKAEAERRALEAQLRAELFGLVQEIGHADTELEVLEREILPDSERALRLSREAFEIGRLSHLELLDAQRTFVEVAKQRIDAATERWRLSSRLDRLIGESR